MVVELTVLGGEKLDKKVGDFIRESKRLQRRVSTAAGEAVDATYGPALVAAVPNYMPDRYAKALAPDLKIETTVRYAGPAPGVRADVSAPTGGKGRDVSAIEAGRLKHPLFGNRGHWYTDRIKRRVFAETLGRTRPLIVRRLDAEIARVRKDLEE